LVLDRDGAQKFFIEEMNFFQGCASLLANNVQFGNRGIDTQQLIRNASEFLNSVRTEIERNNLGPIDQYTTFAKALTVVVGQGAIGRRIAELRNAKRDSEAKWILIVYCAEWVKTASEELAALRAGALGNPAIDAVADLNATAAAKRDAAESRELSQTAASELEQFIRDKTSVINALEKLYREKLVLDEPARYWAQIAGSRTWAWRAWLVLFALLIVGPVMPMILFWKDFADIVTHLTTSNSGPISLAGVAALSIPAFLYGWLLKNVSRMFMHHLSGADDAAHRRALCVTYLGLAANPEIKIEPQDRALILNALFRPAPNQGLEEGPPTGLLDFLKPKGG
jgi:hypothetical protein